jgi:hypothetical protein
MTRAFVALAALLVLAGPASAGVISFGRTGGNIMPLAVTIARDGTVTARGPAQGLRAKLSPAVVAGLIRLARAEGLTASSSTRCAGTLPDIASAWVSVGGKTVTVHGGCRPRFNELYAVLSAVVGLPS